MSASVSMRLSVFSGGGAGIPVCHSATGQDKHTLLVLRSLAIGSLFLSSVIFRQGFVDRRHACVRGDAAAGDVSASALSAAVSPQKLLSISES